MNWNSYTAPDGVPIVGTAETLVGTAMILGIKADGTPEYEGRTDVDWNSQKTILDADGKILFIDEIDRSWTFDQLVKVED